MVLALGTLETLAVRAEETVAGATVKLTRLEVMELVARAQEAVGDNGRIRHLHEELKGRVYEQLAEEAA